MFEKGAIQKSEPAQEEFLNHFVLVQKKDWGKPSGSKSEKKLIHCLQALQNGRFALSEISSETKRFPVQHRSQRRILCNFPLQMVIKICEIQVASQPLRVSLPLCWFRATKFLLNY